MIPSVFFTVNRSRQPYGSAISNLSVSPSVFVMVNRSNHPYGSPVLNPSVILSEISPAKTSMSATRPFLLYSEFPSIIQSVITDGKCMSVISTSNYRQKYSVGDFVAIKQISVSVKARWLR